MQINNFYANCVINYLENYQLVEFAFNLRIVLWKTKANSGVLLKYI